METTTDRFLGGKVSLRQPAKGFRAGMDSVLLAGAVGPQAGHVLDMGCGVGAVMLCAATRLPELRLTGLEREAAMAALARENVSANGMESRVDVVEGDAFALPQDWQNRFDAVVSNPPFFEPGRISAPGEGREAAYLNAGGLRGWINAMLFATRPKGRVALIHRAAELARILSVLERQAGEITVLPLHPREGELAGRVIVTARKGLRPGPMSLLAGWVLHDGDGESAWLAAVARGECGVFDAA